MITKPHGFVLIVAASLALAYQGPGQQPCDKTLRPVEDSLGYRQRGDRCEGIYWQPHANEPKLSVAGLRVQPVPRGTAPDSLLLSWGREAPLSATTVVSIRSVLVRSDKYYQMDTIQPYAAGRYYWPTDVVKALNLALDDLGVYASASVRIGRTDWQVYLPLTSGLPLGSPPTYEVWLIPGMPLLNLAWTCSLIEKDGLPGDEHTTEVLRQRFAAGDVVRVRITPPAYNRFVYLEFEADPVSPNALHALSARLAFFASR